MSGIQTHNKENKEKSISNVSDICNNLKEQSPKEGF
jgi:hypothetical protein